MIEKIVLVAPLSKRHYLFNLLSDQYLKTICDCTNYRSAYRAFSHMVYDSSVITEDIIRDFLNRMRLPHAKYAIMSILIGISKSLHVKRTLSEILSPTLLISGDFDKIIPLWDTIKYHDSEIPNWSVASISCCGHLPYIEKPLEFSNKVLKFLLD
jgi:2-hydroxy-6-oxonona-2,4-dienedioate hydrolase